MSEEIIANNIIQLPVNRVIHSRSYSRKQRKYNSATFDALVESIKNGGFAQCIHVSAPSQSGIYMVIDGDHRLDAARQLCLEYIPAVIDNSVSANNDDEVQADLKNWMLNSIRENPSFAEKADLYRKIELHAPKQISALRKAMGLSETSLNKINQFNRLDEKSKSKLEKEALDENTAVLEAVAAIKKEEDRSEFLDRILSEFHGDAKRVAECLNNAARITGNFSPEVQSHFNGREIPLHDTKAIDLVSLFDTEDEQLAVINRLTLSENIEKTASAFYRLLQNPTSPCTEMKNLITEPNFSDDPQTINAIISLYDLYPHEPEKRLAVVNSLFAQGRLNADYIARIINNIEKSLNGYPGEIQAEFFEGHLPFSDAVFSAIDILLSKKWDLPTSLSLIEKAAAGKFQPEQFQVRLNKLVRDYDETFKVIAGNDAEAGAKFKNIDDAIDSIALSEEEKEVLKDYSGSGLPTDNTRGDRKNSVPDHFEREQWCEPAAEDDGQPESCESEYKLLADSMKRANGTTDIKIEEELLSRNLGRQFSTDFLFDDADEYCKKCRAGRVYDFNLINMCSECYIPHIIGKIQDEETL